jgi:hypothetical protein
VGDTAQELEKVVAQDISAMHAAETVCKKWSVLRPRDGRWDLCQADCDQSVIHANEGGK